ncbi:MAG: hypothetical protein IKB52_03720 [Kiritimatiellae bacterium]|nr:hypothetical protein [Kiritimatiellia bacterium]
MTVVRTIIFAAALAALFAGCSWTPPGGGSCGVEVVGVQYAASTGGEANETVEVLVANRSGVPVRFAGASLDGTDLPRLSGEARAALRAFRFDGAASPFVHGKAAVRPVAGARWWQFYPSETVPAGSFAVFQLNFDGRSRPCRLVLRTEDGRELSADVPRYSEPVRKVAFLSFASGGRSVFAKLAGRGAPVEVRVNGRGAAFSSFPAPCVGGAEVVEAVPAEPVAGGAATLVEFVFADGRSRFALVRAMLGVRLEAPFGPDGDRPLPPGVAGRYGLDDGVLVRRFPYDAVCSDVRAGAPGSMSRDVVGWRARCLAEDPGSLCGVDLCTALYPSAWNIYSQSADAVIVKPYRLHWSASPERFVEDEDAFVRDKVEASAPRPVEWVPERFTRSGGIAGAEFEELAWCAIVRGARGVRIHHWFDGSADPLASDPSLGDAVRRLCAGVRARRGVVESLVPVRSREVCRGRVSVVESWSPGRGVLLLVRRVELRSKRMHGMPAEPLELDVPVPDWLAPSGAEDFLSGEPVGMEASNGSVRLSLRGFGSFMLVWLAGGERRST